MYTQITTPAFYIAVNTIEISVEGIRIEAYSQITPGTKVTVSFDLKKDLLFYGKVMWVMAFQKKDILKFDIGIKIHRITFSGIKVDGFNSKDELIKDILDEFKKV
ncbi:MAG: PilZ domain-containing protein [Deltaproteobacteria bacterium]|nr:PilZ domain-containing protein [Deltaproteobacteria bacterium]